GLLQQPGVQSLVYVEVRRQNPQLGHRILPRRKHGIMPTRRSFHCCIFATSYGKPGVAEEEAGKRLNAEQRQTRSCAVFRFYTDFSHNQKYFQLIEYYQENMSKSEQTLIPNQT